jgi:hypothetical protein
MLKRLHLRNFTVFADAEFEFGDKNGNEKGIKVLVGANGVGKSHVLKAGYVVDFSCATTALDPALGIAFATVGKMYDAFDELINNLERQFPGNTLSNLVRRSRSSGGDIQTEAEAEIQAEVVGATGSLKFTIKADGTNNTHIDKVPDIEQGGVKPVFIPAREVLTLGWLLGFVRSGASLSDAETEKLPIDRTYLNLLRQLEKRPLEAHDSRILHIVEQVKKLAGGDVQFERGEFYIIPTGESPMGINLVAEGMRKFATLYKLLANGTLTSETTLFWDEPEANLNPALLKELAAVLTDLAQAGFQIILATHSLFLMRELHILAQQKKKPVRYFGLYTSEEGDVRVEQQDDLMHLRHLVALDAELAQTFDFEAALDQDYAGDN